MLRDKITAAKAEAETASRIGLVVFVVLGFLALPTVAIGAVLTNVFLSARPIRAWAWQVVIIGWLAVTTVWAAGLTYWPAWRSLAAAMFEDGPVEGWAVAAVAGWGIAAGPVLGALYWRLRLNAIEQHPLEGAYARETRQQLEADRGCRVAQRRQRIAFTPVRDGVLGVPTRVQGFVARRSAIPDHHRKGWMIGRQLGGSIGEYGSRVIVPALAHLVILGRTRWGKTEVMLSQAEQASADGERVIMINGKEPVHRATGPAARLADMADRHWRTSKVLTARDGGRWDPMRGTPDQVRQRLLSIEVFTDPYYEAASTLLLDLSLQLAYQEGKEITSVGELAMSLINGRLKQMAEKQPTSDVLQLVEMLGDSVTAGAAMRWAAQAVRLREWVSPYGWGWEDAEIIGVDLPAVTEPQAAKALMRAMLTDLEAWIADPARRPLDPATGRPYRLRLIVDELGALDSDPVIMARLASLMERAAGAGVGLTIGAQGPAALGDERTSEAFLTNSTVLTTQQADGPAVDRLASLAGTVRVIEASEARGGWDGLQGQGKGSARVQHAFSLHPNILRKLRPGEFVMIESGEWKQIAAAMPSSAYRPVPPIGDLAYVVGPIEVKDEDGAVYVVAPAGTVTMQEIPAYSADGEHTDGQGKE
jgi:hypothetical protein